MFVSGFLILPTLLAVCWIAIVMAIVFVGVSIIYNTCALVILSW
jgi:hypothetical protein